MSADWAALSWTAAGLPALMWTALMVMPGRPWGTRERIETQAQARPRANLSEITVLIPARNEAEVIGITLESLHAQGDGLQIIVIDDQSSDATAQIVSTYPNSHLIRGQPLPPGWTGKLWALEQGRAHVRTALTLLLDADIQLCPGLLEALLSHKRREGRHFVSLMADLRRGESFWDRLLLPLFVYYFKLVYPFALSNSSCRYVAAAAGGCVLVDSDALTRIGAFASLRNALIDDCALAHQIKSAGYRTWIGLSRGVVSLRPYGTLRSIHDMVARSAFTQLGYSTAALFAVTVLFVVAYWTPLALLDTHAWPLAGLALAWMFISYQPVLRYYRMSPLWALVLPVSAMLYLAMTWSSAIRHWGGTRSHWKGRRYGV